MKEYEYSRSSYLTSMKGWLGYGKTPEQEEEERLQLEKFKEQLEKESK